MSDAETEVKAAPEVRRVHQRHLTDDRGGNRLLTSSVEERLREQFGNVLATKPFDPDDLMAGRAHIRAYVEFIHFAERLYDSTVNATHGPFEESQPPSNDR